MAKRSKIVANERRKQTVARFADKRRELKEQARMATSLDERMSLQQKLARLPRNASPTRVRNRDVVDGRPRGHLRKFGLSRVRFREMAHKGELPGVTKSSW